MYTLMLIVWAHWWSLTPTTIVVESYQNADECVVEMANAQDYYKDAHSVSANCTDMSNGAIFYARGDK